MFQCLFLETTTKTTHNNSEFELLHRPCTKVKYACTLLSSVKYKLTSSVLPRAINRIYSGFIAENFSLSS